MGAAARLLVAGPGGEETGPATAAEEIEASARQAARGRRHAPAAAAGLPWPGVLGVAEAAEPLWALPLAALGSVFQVLG